MMFHARRDMMLLELWAVLAERGLIFGYGTLWRFFNWRGYTRKKRPRTQSSRPWCRNCARATRGGGQPEQPQGPGMIDAVGARLLYLPPYRPDFNPIENLFAKLKALLRREAARTIDTLWSTIGRILDLVTPRECQNMFTAAGYDPDWWD